MMHTSLQTISRRAVFIYKIPSVWTSAICPLCDKIKKVAYISHCCHAKSPERQRLLIHGLLRGTGTPEMVVMEVIKSHLT